VEIVSDFVAGGYSADCSCGWSSERYHTTAEALAASEMHRTIDHVELVDLDTGSTIAWPADQPIERQVRRP